MRKLAPIVAVLGFIGCTPPPQAPQPFTAPDVVISAPPERVWAALTEVYTELNLPIENMDRSSWFLRSDQMPFRPASTNSALFDCGTAFLGGHGMQQVANSATITASLTTLLIPGADGTGVRNRVNATAHHERLGTIPCQSTGVLEKRIGDALQARRGQ